MKKQLTAEQIAARDARRAKFQTLVKAVHAMSEVQRAEIVGRVGGVPTCEGRVLSGTNSVLCILQMPTVSLVGGFRQWLKAGRAVRKGEHGISIWIPIGAPKVDGETQGEAGEVHFTGGTVFDISQTDAIAAPAQLEEVAA